MLLGVEAAYRQIPGVISTTVGYLGGTMENPTYRDVCSGRTGHAEVVQVAYDPSRVTYDDLLTVFWENHNPTTLNRQGPDVGTQYRSAIFYHDDTQKELAIVSKEEREHSGASKEVRCGHQSQSVRVSRNPEFTAGMTWFGRRSRAFYFGRAR